MPPVKKSAPSKFITEEFDDFLTDSEFLNGSPKKKQPTKKQATAEVPNWSFNTDQTGAKKKKINQSIEACGESRQKTLNVELPNLSMNTNQTGAKKKIKYESIEAGGESQQKILNVMNRQLDARKQLHEKMFKNLSDDIEDMEADYNALKENEQKVEHLFGSFMKCMKQSTAAYKEKLNSFKELHANFKKRYEDIHLDQQGEMKKLVEKLEEDISQLKEKLIEETKRGEWEHLQKCFMKAMQNNF